MGDLGQQMLAVIREIDAVLQENKSPQEPTISNGADEMDLPLLTLIASEPFNPHLVLEELVKNANQD